MTTLTFIILIAATVACIIAARLWMRRETPQDRLDRKNDQEGDSW